MEAWNYYWNNIEDWSDNSGTNIELYDTVPNHEEMHKECIRYDNWIHAKTDPSVVSQDVINILRNNFEDAPSMKWDGGKFVPDTIWKRWFAVPNAEHFPSIHKFLEDNKHQYHLSVISKLGPGGVILPHTHKLIDKGNFVGYHLDTDSNPDYIAACVVQLGSDYTGGKYRVHQKNGTHNDFTSDFGDLIISNCNYPHEVTKVESGNRKSLVFFVSNDPGKNKRNN